VTILFGILVPVSLLIGIPACYFAYKSKRSLKEMKYGIARTQSLIAAYLGVATIIFGMFGISAIILFTLGFRYA